MASDIARRQQDEQQGAIMTTNGTRSEEEIQQDVLDELKWDARLQPNEIGVTG
jgi:hypothetical protein